MIKQSDQWETPQWLFDELNEEFDFDIDLCATELNCKVFNTFDDSDWASYCKNYLAEDLKPKGVNCAFMNPPYSNPRPFVEKAFKDAKEYKITIVCLLKCDPSTKTWGVFWDYNNHKPKPGVEVRFLPKRVKFDSPSGLALEVRGNKYKIKCDDFTSIGSSKNSFVDKSECKGVECLRCKGTGFRWANLAGASFPSCVVIFRGEEM